MYQKGTTLLVDYGTFSHYGISDGNGGVIHNSKKRMMVMHESEIEFSDGKEICVSNIKSNNPQYALKKAISYIGMPYNLVKSNCEHFVRLCHGLNVESTQIQKYLLATAFASIAIYNKNPIIKYASASASFSVLCTPKEEDPLKYAAYAVLLTLGIALITT